MKSVNFGASSSMYGFAATALCIMGLLAPVSAGAHAPYEHPEAKLRTNDGGEVLLIKSYVDGVFSVDPVKVVVRDLRSGEDRAETDYGRDVVLSCVPGNCIVFLFADTWSVMPAQSYLIQDGILSDAINSSRLRGVFCHLSSHLFGYVLSVFVGAFFIMLLQLKGGRLRRLSGGLGAVWLLFLWFYVVMELSRLSLPVAGAALSAGGVSCQFLMIRRSKHSAV